ncbi:uncharacterized protein LOC134253532 [Saccostrea cucullata]|uniref:uncharacterized protein LOC134253532 n=1 Tax=Saccostrea cuccullata TaxID=36930 RepID=UPI002ED39534
MAQDCVQTCVKHNAIIDVFCEDCDLCLCSDCTRCDHGSHNWVTLVRASTEKRKELSQILNYVKNEKLPDIDKHIEKTSKRIEEIENQCESEINNLRMHNNEIITKLSEIMIYREKKIRENQKKKNEEIEILKSNLLEKRKILAEKVEFLEEYSTTSELSLVNHHRELRKMLSETDIDERNIHLSVRYRKGKIINEELEQMIGQTINLDDIGAEKSCEFQHGCNGISILEALNTDECFLKNIKSSYVEQVDKNGEEKQKFNIDPDDVCVADDGRAYITDASSNCISCISSSGSRSTVFSAHPLVPVGICKSRDGRSGLLITLREEFDNSESDKFLLNSQSRRLLRHMSIMGDLNHEIEFEKDSEYRLFTYPWRVTQNRYAEICVVNQKSSTSGELVILSRNGRKKSVYGGKVEDFTPYDVVYDSCCNILVTDGSNHCVHVLSREGEFLRYLLTEKDVNDPMSLSLYKSTLWLGESNGLVKLFNYKSVSWSYELYST